MHFYLIFNTYKILISLHLELTKSFSSYDLSIQVLIYNIPSRTSHLQKYLCAPPKLHQIKMNELRKVILFAHVSGIPINGIINIIE